MVTEMGKRWAEIVRRLGNRSKNAVENWWNASMNRKRRGISLPGGGSLSPRTLNGRVEPPYPKVQVSLGSTGGRFLGTHHIHFPSGMRANVETGHQCKKIHEWLSTLDPPLNRLLRSSVSSPVMVSTHQRGPQSPEEGQSPLAGSSPSQRTLNVSRSSDGRSTSTSGRRLFLLLSRFELTENGSFPGD